MTQESFLKSHLFENVMSSGGLDGWSNYGGPDLSGWLCGPAETRDSDTLAQSNFAVALDMLGGEVDGQVDVRNCGHWACGWFKQIMVKADSPQAKILFDIYVALDHYPVLDDSDHSERESESYSEYAEGAKESVALVLVTLFGLPEELAESEDMLNLAYDLNMECQYYAGPDSCLFNNQYHVDRIDDSDLRRYEECLKGVISNGRSDDNPATDLIAACFGIAA